MLLRDSIIAIAFIAYLIFWIQIPGMLIESYLLPARLKWSTKLGAGFYMGFTVLAIIYYVESLLKLKYVISVAGPLLSIIAIYLYIKKGRPSLCNEGEEIRPTFYIILGIIFVMCLLGFVLQFINATEGITTQVFHDNLFHIGNIVALSRSFPNYDIRVDGIVFYYHYFMDLLFAMCKRIFGMNAFDLYIMGDAPMSAWALAPALITIGERIKGDKVYKELKYFIVCFSAFLCCVGVMAFTVRWRNTPHSWNNNHMFCNGNAIGIAVALTILVLDVLVEIWDEEWSVKLIIANILMMIAATGFKGTTGLQLAGIIPAVFVIELLITKKFSKQKLAYAITSVISFIVTYIVVVAGWNTNGSNNRATTFGVDGDFSSLELSAMSNYMIQSGRLSRESASQVAVMILLNIICITGPLIVTFVAFSVSRLKELIKTGSIGNIFDWFCIGSVIIAWIGYSCFGIEGMSQAYLVLGVAPLIVYCSINYAREKKRILSKILIACTFIGGAYLVALDVQFYLTEIQNQNKIYRSLDKDRTDVVSYFMMDGYYWLRDNTPENSLVATDIHTENLDFRYIYFYCSAFSERQCYIEGYDYTDVNESISDKMMAINSMFYLSDAEVVEASLEKYGIDYLVVSERENPGYEAPTERLSLCYSNPKIKIYKFE